MDDELAPTHVLVWNSPWTIARSHRHLGGFWEVQTIDESGRYAVTPDKPMVRLQSKNPVILAAWAELELGFPVRLDRSWRWVDRWLPLRRVPVYWATPAGGRP